MSSRSKANRSLFFERMCARQAGKFRDAELSVKKAFARQLKCINHLPIHRELLDQFDVVLTTNYDHTLEASWSGPLYEHCPVYPESRYSLFRRLKVGAKQIWHVHGDVDYPSSLVLGYDQYAGYLQKIRNYLTEGIKVDGAGTRRSPLKIGAMDFQAERLHHSWVDFFLRDHLHIVGLGLGFTEIDLWWLLLHKRRRATQTGRTFYYDAVVGPSYHSNSDTKSVLRALGVEVLDVPADSYAEGYAAVVSLVAKNIRENSAYLPVNPSNVSVSPTMSTDAQVNSRAKSAQLQLRFRRKKLRARSP